MPFIGNMSDRKRKGQTYGLSYIILGVLCSTINKCDKKPISYIKVKFFSLLSRYAYCRYFCCCCCCSSCGAGCGWRFHSVYSFTKPIWPKSQSSHKMICLTKYFMQITLTCCGGRVAWQKKPFFLLALSHDSHTIWYVCARVGFCSFIVWCIE